MSLPFAYRFGPATVLSLAACVQAPPDTAAPDRVPARLRVEVSYAAGVHDGPLTGRLFLAVSPTADPEPRIAAYNSARQRDGRVPFFATDVTDVEPGETMVIDVGVDGYPYARLGELPAGDYWVQALVHVYTEYHRQDGRVIRAPQDQWEGQRWAFSPGNLVSAPQRVSVDPTSDVPLRLALTDVIPPMEPPSGAPRLFAVTIQHPTPFFDNSYGLNSANNGPYGDAIHQELIPYLEANFRMIGAPYARVLTGGSTGGWIASPGRSTIRRSTGERGASTPIRSTSGATS